MQLSAWHYRNELSKELVRLGVPHTFNGKVFTMYDGSTIAFDDCNRGQNRVKPVADKVYSGSTLKNSSGVKGVARNIERTWRAEERLFNTTN